MSKITVIGAGYVGLVSAACFAKKGMHVVVVEKDKNKIQRLQQGKPHFYEPGLEALVSYGVQNKLITFTESIKEALADDTDIIFSCVGTPSMPDGSVDLSYVKLVATEIGKYLNNYALVVNKSTVPVGTAKAVKSIINEQLKLRNLDIKFEVASNPEFLKEGTAVNDSMYPDRIVVGVSSRKSENILRELYKPFIETDDQFITMNEESSELTKYASNSMLATRISFMNQLALLADKVGADIKLVKKGMSYDKRIGKEFLNAGIGYGGSCFPKDVKALVDMGIKYNQPMTIVHEVDKVNNKQRQLFIDKINKHYKNELNEKTVAIIGLSFKPNTDDIRYAPSIDVISQLLKSGAKIIAYDPVAMDNIKEIFNDEIQYAKIASEAIKQADFAVLLTEWDEFKNLKIEEWLRLKDRTIFDARNFYDKSYMVANGINYYCIGSQINKSKIVGCVEKCVEYQE